MTAHARHTPMGPAPGPRWVNRECAECGIAISCREDATARPDVCEPCERRRFEERLLGALERIAAALEAVPAAPASGPCMTKDAIRMRAVRARRRAERERAPNSSNACEVAS